MMTIATIVVNDLSNPVEVQVWLTANPAITAHAAWNTGAMFYILYE